MASRQRNQNKNVQPVEKEPEISLTDKQLNTEGSNLI